MRWLVRLIGSVLVLIFLLGLMVVLMPKDRVAQMAADRFASATGRKLTIEGSVRPSIWPVLGVKTGPVRLANADWGTEPDMLRAERLDIGLDLAALLSGVVKITGIEVVGPDLLLERHKDGRVNWDLSPATDVAAEGSAPAQAAPGYDTFTLDHGRIRDGRLRYVDRAAGQAITLEDVALESAIPDYTGPVSLQGSAQINGQRVTLSATVAELGAFLDGKTTGLDLGLVTGRSRLSLVGTAGFDPVQVEGRLSADLSDKSALAAVAGQTIPDLPQGFGRETLALETGLQLDAKGAVRLRDLAVQADGGQITGQLDWLPGKDRPLLRGDLAMGAVALPRTSEDSAPKAAEGSGWPKEEIDVSALGAFDADLTLAAQSIDLGSVKLGQTRATVALDRARAVITLRDAAGYGGKINGEFVVNGRKGLSVGGDLSFAGLSMQPLLADVAGFDRLLASGDLRVKFLGVGNSLDAILRGLSGEAQMRVGKGELRGLDVAGMLRTLDPGYVGEGAKTIFDTMSIGVMITDGVAASEDLAISAPLFAATGAGKVDLGGQKLDYRLMPRLLPKSDGTGGVEIPILISGAWADPKIRLDLEWLARQRLTEEKARAEAAAKARLEELAREKLGVEALEGENLEGAAKRRAKQALEDEAARALGRLLGND